ncbi:MAG TPA: ABC transporter substrate-binding protein [Aggregatilineales bacterium]|nr:ABC transporter substrate-binding protein [Aggregatilineales bacterium]
MKTRLGTLLLVVMIAAFSGAGHVQGQGAATPSAPGDPLGGATTFAKANQPANITVMLDYTPNTNHLGIYAAQALGYYQDAGLTVTIQQPGDVQPEEIVATGKAQFGVSYQEGTTLSRAENVPIVSLAAIIQHNTSGFAALHDKRPLKTPADLVGLTYGAFGSPTEKPMIDALIACAGVDASIKPVKFVDVGSAEPIPLMEKGQIDFVWLFYAWDGIRARQQGIKLDFLMLSDYTNCVPDYYTPLLITSEDMIKNQPDVVRAFTQATARGYAYAIQNPDKAADLLIKAVPDIDAKLVTESAEWLASQFQADASSWGQQADSVWKAYTDFAVKNGVIKAPIDYQAAYTNNFLPGK